VAGPHKADDDLAYFAASLGRTVKLLAVAGGSVQLPDDGGPLVPGRYLIQILDVSVVGAQVWVVAAKFEKGLPPISVPTDAPAFPFAMEGVIALETNVRLGDSDQIAARTSAGTATVYITKISRPL
jgi:hypothetical protein